MKFKLAILVSHPIQYFVPLYKRLAHHPDIDLRVYYGSDFGVTAKVDNGFGKIVKWDIPLLEGYNYQFLKNYSLKPSPDRFLGVINPGIFRELKKYKYDAIIIQGYYLLSYWLGFISASLSKIAIFLQGESNFTSHKRQFLKRQIKNILLKTLFKNIYAFLYIGSRNKKYYQHYGVSEDKLFFTPYSVNNEFFLNQANIYKKDKEKIKRELNIPENSVVTLYSGKLIERKKPLDLLKAYSLLKMNLDTSLVFIGDGILKNKMEDFTRDNNLKNVFILGFKNQSEVSRYYSIGDIFVLPSTYQETWGLVVNEAMCFGMPIIVSDRAGCGGDLVKHKENGYIYPAGDINTLAFYLTKLTEDPLKREAMGRRSQEIIQNWNYEICLNSILKALEYIKKYVKRKSN